MLIITGEVSGCNGSPLIDPSKCLWYKQFILGRGVSEPKKGDGMGHRFRAYGRNR